MIDEIGRLRQNLEDAAREFDRATEIADMDRARLRLYDAAEEYAVTRYVAMAKAVKARARGGV